MSGLAVRAVGALALLAATQVVLADTPPAGPASIAFANHGGVYNWEADSTKGLWVQDRSRNWYYATLLGPCSGLNFAQTLGFVTEPDGSLNQHSAVTFMDGSKMAQRCTFRTFERSAPPPSPAKHQQPVQKSSTSK